MRLSAAWPLDQASVDSSLDFRHETLQKRPAQLSPRAGLVLWLGFLMRADSRPVGAPAARLPRHERTYRALRDLILFGGLAPGEKVTLFGLAERLQTGVTPVREAIRRLMAEGALILHDNRRVSVPLLSEKELDELAFARLALEPELARRAALRADQAAVARLEEIDHNIDQAIAAADVSRYLRTNWEFHTTLYALAEAPFLAALVQALWLRIGPSLRVVIETGLGPEPDRHREALSALAARDADGVAQAIAADIRQGLARIRAHLSP